MMRVAVGTFGEGRRHRRVGNVRGRPKAARRSGKALAAKLR